MYNIYESLEILNKEKYEIKNSKKYKIGNAIVKYSNDILRFNFKRVFIDLKNKRVSKIIKKKYYHPLQYNCIKKNNVKCDKCKIAVYTCIFGNYDNLQKPLVEFDNVDYYIFTDNVKKYHKFQDIYKVIEISKELLKKGNIIANRYIKLHPIDFFGEYDYAIYLDGNVRVVSDIRDFIQYINQITGIAMHLHRERKCIYEEAEVCKLLRRGNIKKIDEQMKKYRNEGFPQNFGMNEASIIVSDLKNKKSIKLLDKWYLEFLKSGSLRDQLAWPYILWKNNYRITDIGILGNDIYKNYKVEMTKHNDF